MTYHVKGLTTSGIFTFVILVQSLKKNHNLNQKKKRNVFWEKLIFNHNFTFSKPLKKMGTTSEPGCFQLISNVLLIITLKKQMCPIVLQYAEYFLACHPPSPEGCDRAIRGDPYNLMVVVKMFKKIFLCLHYFCHHSETVGSLVMDFCTKKMRKGGPSRSVWKSWLQESSHYGTFAKLFEGGGRGEGGDVF